MALQAVSMPVQGAICLECEMKMHKHQDTVDYSETMMLRSSWRNNNQDG